MVKALAEYQRKIKEGLIDRPTPKDPIEKLKTKPKSLRLAINAKCFDCCCGQKIEIKRCTVPKCPLFNVRPYQEKNKQCKQ